MLEEDEDIRLSIQIFLSGLPVYGKEKLRSVDVLIFVDRQLMVTEIYADASTSAPVLVEESSWTE